MHKILIRNALKSDAAALLELVAELAEYERSPGVVVAQTADYASGLEEGLFSALVAETEGKIVGMALFFPYFSTWNGKALYLEDFIVKEGYRRTGIGKKLFDAFLDEAYKQGAKLAKWNVLEWNEPAKNFYRKYPVAFYSGWEIGVVHLKQQR